MSDSPANMNLAKIVHRVIADPKGWRVDDLLNTLGIGERCYRNYRKRLQDHFGPFQSTNGDSCLQEVRLNGVKYLKLVDMPSTQNHEDSFPSRLAALHFAKLLLGFVDETPVGGAFSDILDEFEDRLQDRSFTLNHLMRNVDRIFYQLPDAPKDYSNHGDTIQAIVHGMIFTKKVQVTYESASFDAFDVVLEPYTLAVHRSALYLIARAEGREDIRIWAVDRIQQFQALDDRFDYPTAGAYSPKDYTEGSFGIYRSDATDRTKFVLKFKDKRWLKLFVQERQWHPTQKFQELKNGQLKMTFSVNTEMEVWPWIRSFGDDVTVVRPDRPQN